MLRHSIKRRLLVLIVLVAVVPVVFLGYSGYSNNRRFINEKEEEEVSFFFNQISAMIVKFFSITSRDIEFLKAVTEDHMPNSYENLDEQRKKDIKDILYNFSKVNVQYDQVRFINSKGYEKIRINNYQRIVNIVPENELRYRGDSQYMKEACKLMPDEVYISDINPHYEDGEIEKPLKPVAKYIVPIYTDEKLRGFVILNLNVGYLLMDIKNRKNQSYYDNIMIFDNNGCYMMNYDKSKEWGCRKGLGTGENFKKDYPGLFKEIYSSELLTIKDNGSNILAWHTVKIKGFGNRKLSMFLDISKDEYLQPLSNFRNLFMFQIMISILVLIIGGMMISTYLTRPILKIVNAVESIGKGHFDVEIEIKTGDELELLGYEIKKMSYELKDIYKNMEEIVDERTKELQLAHQEMEEMATKDSLTGLYNRHYFNQYIQNIDKNIGKNHRNLMILIIDVDKFKSINDNYGHNIGDVVLKDVAEILKNSSRESDIAVRYGGDEFLVALYDSKIELAEKYIERVKEYLDQWNRESDILNHELTLSIGYDEYSGEKHILEAINNADKMMYDNKIAKREQG